MPWSRELKVLVVASPTPASGGGLRALRSLREYAKHFSTSLFIPWGLWGNERLLSGSTGYLKELRSLSVRLVGFSRLPKLVPKLREVLGTRMLEIFLPMVVPSMARIEACIADYDAVVVLHEVWDAVYSGRVLAELLDAPSAVLLQLPPFYDSRERFLDIVKASLLWRELIGGNHVERKLFEVEAIVRSSAEWYLDRLRYEKVLGRYTLVLGVSKAVAAEMGGAWLDKVKCFDPGVSLDDEDLEVIRSIRRRVKEKGNYVVLGGRPSTDKGLAEALVSFKFLSRHFPGIKLVVTGRMSPQTFARIKKVCRKLDIESKTVLTGFVPREERLEIVAKAKLMLYPSHVDAFPYAVLESLHLGTPVVAYRIPAIEMYFGKSPGVELVEEGDIEALTAKSIEVLERGAEPTKPPHLRCWREIMSEELEIVSKLASQRSVAR